MASLETELSEINTERYELYVEAASGALMKQVEATPESLADVGRGMKSLLKVLGSMGYYSFSRTEPLAAAVKYTGLVSTLLMGNLLSRGVHHLEKLDADTGNTFLMSLAMVIGGAVWEKTANHAYHSIERMKDILYLKKHLSGKEQS